MLPLCAAAILLLSGADAAYADCDLVPNGTTILSPETRPEGAIIYNSDTHAFQACLNDEWVLAHGQNGYMCGYIQGACPDSASGLAGCMSGQPLTWGTVNCSINGGNTIQTVTFSNPRIYGQYIGGTDSAEINESVRAFCFDLGLAFSSYTSVTNSSHWYDSQQTTASDGTYWRDRGSTSANKATQIVCTDMLNSP
jgi:hypothetical protein